MVTGSVNEAAVTPDEDVIYALKREILSLRTGCDRKDLFGDRPPAELLTDYPLQDLDGQLSRPLQKKYKKRRKNIKRCWNRTQLFLPELMSREAPKQKILELSTAHGGMLEVLRHFGHEVTGNDYVNTMARTPEDMRAMFRDVNAGKAGRRVDDYGLPVPDLGQPLADWPYRRIIESIDIPMSLFDAGRTPYPHEDKEFDVLICMQAIEHYCHAKDWMTLLDEFCRITRKTIILLLNPLMDIADMPEGYAQDYARARLDLRRYRRNGFVCSSCHMLWGEPVGFKLTAI